MAVMSIPKFERLFRIAAELDVDKSDLKRYTDFVNEVIRGLLIRAVANAEANARDIIQPSDLPITKGLEQCIQEFRKVDAELKLEPILDELTILPPLDIAYSPETELRLPYVAGGLSVALARTFKIIDPKIKEPASDQWERCFKIFSLLL
jgi:hypothetical protein